MTIDEDIAEFKKMRMLHQSMIEEFRVRATMRKVLRKIHKLIHEIYNQ